MAGAKSGGNGKAVAYAALNIVSASGIVFANKVCGRRGVGERRRRAGAESGGGGRRRAAPWRRAPAHRPRAPHAHGHRVGGRDRGGTWS